MSEQLKKTYTARKINKHRLEAIKKYAGKSILDVGCGNGAYVLEFKDSKDIKGVDYQKFDTWEEAPELFSVASADNLSSFGDSSVDSICSYEVLEHMKDPESVLKEFHRICRDNIIITVPNCAVTKSMKSSGLIFYHWIDPTHIQFFVKSTLEEMVTKSGFEIIHSEYINQISLTPILMESFDLENASAKSLKVRLVKWLIKKYSKKDYFITLLLVAKKI